MIKHLKKWFLFLLLSVLVGGGVGFFLLWSWFLFRWIFLGYGDSGPQWIDIVNTLVFWGGFALSIVGGQILFIVDYRMGRTRGRP